MDACETASSATAARRHAVAATHVAGVAEASVRAVRLCAESGGLVVILCSYSSVASAFLSARNLPSLPDNKTTAYRTFLRRKLFQNSRPSTVPYDYTERKS